MNETLVLRCLFAMRLEGESKSVTFHDSLSVNATSAGPLKEVILCDRASPPTGNSSTVERARESRDQHPEFRSRLHHVQMCYVGKSNNLFDEVSSFPGS